MNKNTVWWIIGIIVVIALVVWLVGMRNQPGAQQSTGQNATTTSQTATTSNQGGGQRVGVVNRSSATVASVVASIPSASQFKALLAASGVSLSGKGPYTVFVPVDSGFKYITPGTITSMTAAQKKRLVQYHIVSGRALNVSATDSGTIQALSKDMLNFNVQDSGAVQVNSAFVLSAYRAKNGVVYVITQPLIPPVNTQ